MFLVVVGIEIKISVSMCWFTINVDHELSVIACDEGVKKRKFAIRFMFDGERNVLVNRVQ